MVNGELKMVNGGRRPLEVWDAICIASCGSHPLPSRFARHPPPNGGGQVNVVAEWPFSPQSCRPPLDGGRGTTIVVEGGR